MISYYKFDLISNDGRRLVYPVDLKKIRGIKYEWNPENKGIGGGVVHAVVCCESDEDLSATLTTITKTEFDNADKIEFISDKANINANASDVALLTATMPKAKGKVTFKCIMPDGTVKLIEKNVGSNKKAISISDLKSSQKGKIKITVFSDVFFAPQTPRKVVEIDAI